MFFGLRINQTKCIMMELKYTAWTTLVITALIFSCSEKNIDTDGKEVNNQLILTKVDSLDFKLLGDPIVADISAAGDRVLIFDYANSEIITLDQEGRLLGKFSKKDDSPDAYGFMMELPGFIGENQIAINGMRGIFIYDYEGNQVKTIKHPESVSGAAFLPMTGKSIKGITRQGKDYLLSKSVRSRNTFPGEQAFYDRYRALEWIDIETGESTEIIPFEEGSLFRNGKGYIESDYSPAFEWIENRLFISLGGEPRLMVYRELGEKPILDTIITLSIQGFLELPIRERSEFVQGTIMADGGTPAIRNIHQTKDYLLIHYYGGMDPEKTKEAGQLWQSGKGEEAELLFEKLEKEVSKGILIFDRKTLQEVGRLALPEEVEKGGFLAAGDFLWFQKAFSEEKEEDFIRIYKFKLGRS